MSKNSFLISLGIFLVILLEKGEAASVRNVHDVYFRSRPEYDEDKQIEEMNVCIDICSECFKEDLENKENNQNALVVSCANHCILTEYPIKTMSDWFRKNSADAQMPNCLVEYDYE